MPDELTLETERNLLRSILDRVGYRLSTEHEIESRHATEVAAEQRQYQAVFQQLTDNYEAERLQLEQNHQSQLAACDYRCQSESAQVQSEYQRILTEAEDRYNRDHEAATKEHDEAVWLVSSLLDDDTEGSPLQRFQQAQLAHEAAEIELKARIESQESGYEQVVRFLQRSHIWSEPTEPESTVQNSSVEAMKTACLAAFDASEPLRQKILGRLLPSLFIGIVPIFVFLGFSGLLFAIIWGQIDPSLLKLQLKSTDPDWLYIAAGSSLGLSLIPMLIMHLMASRKVWPDYEMLHQQLIDARRAYSIWERTSMTDLNMLEAECSHLQELRVKRRDSAINGAESKMQNRVAEIQQIWQTVVQQASAKYPSRLNFLESRRVGEREQIEKKYQADSQDLIFRRESDFRMLQSEFDLRTADSRKRYQQAWMDLIRAWRADVSQFAKISDNLCQAAKVICPDWNVVSRENSPFPTESPAILSLGRIDVDLESIEGGLSSDARLKTDRQRFDVPVLLPLLERPSLILKSTGKGRDAAVKTIQATMLRFLTSLPPGKVRFTILDPVGLGANFSAFMHLADFDELLVTSRIWTEPSHIEKRLADLTEHMETVLQMYLRNEFSTIDQYNEYAGEVAEPYRVLVVANFPANFTDIALRRLASIAEGGSRCGVHLLMTYDLSLEMPRSFSPSDLEKHATVFNWTNEGFRISDPEFGKWPLTLEQPPSADEFGQIVRLAGQHSKDVRRVEVPFERVAPSEADFWTSDSRSGIDVPIGRAGATKLQNMRLGKGTSQHVLVAGKTGSGKSTLLHALITNLSLYYSPAEVEFYLIDFKKGVEFKVYADQRLPHARVIAIESDREFGVSVLERLDSLLRDRGEQFREVGVQDIAGYRNARPNEVMPRTLLLIDEFQEYFVEDDAISQQAALLLDRLIRQGRAFGVHVILGSQTLAGAYSLARSTLGQVAVRIALQCSDTDAHLILSEENSAARLLTRPGEAIYNDANGLIEGNHPFQVVWLSDDEREGYLSLVREEADGQGRHMKATAAIRAVTEIPAVVFEGNIPADPTTNHHLQRLLENSRTSIASGHVQTTRPDSTWSCWLGDSVSLEGPMELRFGLREGGNILIVGRDERAALGVMTASAMAFCAQAIANRSTGPAVSLLDGSLPNSQSSATWRQVETAWNQFPNDSSADDGELRSTMRVVGLRETNSLLTDLIAELHRREEEPGSPMFLFIFDLARFRDLRKAEDDYGFGGSGDKPVSATQLFTDILKDGPAVGIFTFVWVESYQSVQRWLSRDQMNRFEQRILFAMNSNDSSSLVDSPLAGRLGENRGLLYRGDVGTLEKFRPFSPPPDEWISQIAIPTVSEPPVRNVPVHTSAVTPQHVIVPEKSPVPEPAEVDLSDELPNIDDLHVQ